MTAQITTQTTAGLHQQVKVVYINANNDSWLLSVAMTSASISAAEALEQSGLCDIFPWWKIDNLSLGVFSKAVTSDHRLQAGDRLEIYDDLTIDPKRARQLKVEKQRRRNRQKTA